MRIFAFADSHGAKEITERLTEVTTDEIADVIVCAGDYTHFARPAQALYDVLEKTKVPVIYVYGNHEHDVKSCHINCGKDIDNQVLVIDEIAYCGLSGHDLFNQSRQWRIAEVFDYFKEKLAKISYKKLVLVTHEPPSSWLWPENEDKNAGNPLIDSFIKEVGADLVICGHLHVREAAETVIDGHTRVVNPLPEALSSTSKVPPLHI